MNWHGLDPELDQMMRDMQASVAEGEAAAKEHAESRRGFDRDLERIRALPEKEGGSGTETGLDDEGR